MNATHVCSLSFRLRFCRRSGALSRAGLMAVLLALAVLTAGGGVAQGQAGGDWDVLPETLGGAPRSEMMRLYLQAHTATAQGRWKEAYEARKSDAEIAAYQAEQRAFFEQQLGGWFEKTPLRPQITGVVERPGFTVEKILFESMPGVYVTAALFLPDPDRFAPPWPGVVVACGHTANGKAYDGYQRACALMALNGMAALIVDPFDQGERRQLLDHPDAPGLWGTQAHTMVGVGSILVGRNAATYMVWDLIRAIDYLQSRPDIDPDRIGAAGNSGGGTQSAYLMALDDRVQAAAPNCYLCGLYDRIRKLHEPQDGEQNIFGQLAFGMDHADYVMMRAPRPTLVLVATDDFFDVEDAWDLYRHAKRLYSRMGHGQKVGIVENDGPHGWAPILREATAQWMNRWLRDQWDDIREPDDLTVLSEEEMRVTPQGQVLHLEGARSLYEINSAFERELAEQRTRLWEREDRAALMDQVRQIAGFPRWNDLSDPEIEIGDPITSDSCVVQKLVIRPEPGIHLPALLFRPIDAEGAEGSGRVVLVLAEEGKNAVTGPDGPLAAWVGEGATVLAVDLRGVGETRQTNHRYFQPWFGQDGQDVYTAYLLGRSYVGMWATDILACVRALEVLAPAGDGASDGPRPVDLVVRGNLGVAALHAAAAEPERFGAVEISGAIRSWADVVHAGLTRNQLVNAVHGALAVYDLPDLAGALGDSVRLLAPAEPR